MTNYIVTVHASKGLTVASWSRIFEDKAQALEFTKYTTEMLTLAQGAETLEIELSEEGEGDEV